MLNLADVKDVFIEVQFSADDTRKYDPWEVQEKIEKLALAGGMTSADVFRTARGWPTAAQAEADKVPTISARNAKVIADEVAKLLAKAPEIKKS